MCRDVAHIDFWSLVTFGAPDFKKKCDVLDINSGMFYITDAEVTSPGGERGLQIRGGLTAQWFDMVCCITVRAAEIHLNCALLLLYLYLNSCSFSPEEISEKDK